MELKDFIKTTLLELAQGISEAGKELNGQKMAIAEATIGKSGEATTSSTSRIKFTLEASFNSQCLFQSGLTHKTTS